MTPQYINLFQSRVLPVTAEEMNLLLCREKIYPHLCENADQLSEERPIYLFNRNANVRSMNNAIADTMDTESDIYVGFDCDTGEKTMAGEKKDTGAFQIQATSGRPKKINIIEITALQRLCVLPNNCLINQVSDKALRYLELYTVSMSRVNINYKCKTTSYVSNRGRVNPSKIVMMGLPDGFVLREQGWIMGDWLDGDDEEDNGYFYEEEDGIMC
ncbi:uncharacterized protein EV154DRAFT_588949 [Mucor mucedo]|uniref:uncharacterized protein n=1 Tax=Mucor mucedo TaxID=29922 RepID=UPI0022202D47|nr:uncharacterized protein EV154DRAFT_588949 [Mucor mucedo]KAI7891046.1 hypothetical protein EV154DRAFT_588949 [Mucor mucedo]